MKKTGIIITISIVLLVIVLIVVLWKQGVFVKLTGKPVGKPSETPTGVFPLKVGSKNEWVEGLQFSINKAAGQKVVPQDGNFTQETQNFLKLYSGKTQINSEKEYDEVMLLLQTKLR